MKQQTAVEWFAFELSKLGLLPDGVPNDIYKQAKEMEKEKIKKAWVDGNYNTDDNGIPSKNYAASDEGYYKKTYGGNK